MKTAHEDRPPTVLQTLFAVWARDEARLQRAADRHRIAHAHLGPDAGQGPEVGTVRAGAARGPDTGADGSQEGEMPGQEGAWSLTFARVTAFIYDCSHRQQMRGFESWQS